jgi:8-oxo-dGTP diphosphatase
MVDVAYVFMKKLKIPNVELRTELIPRIQVAAGLVYHDGRYLIAKRRPQAHLGGLWEFPGGKQETGESLEECLARELREELGIEIARPALFRIIRHRYRDKVVELHFFRCRLKGGQPRPLGCEDFRWVTASDLRHYRFPPADQPLIEALERETADVFRTERGSNDP